MMISTLSFGFTLLSLGLIVNAQHNITVNNTSPSITYGGNAQDASVCKIDSNGNVVGGQAGCWNIPSQCTEGVSFGQGGSGTAEFSFKGSAVYINSALFQLSPVYTVTIDGESTDVDGVRDSRPFSCYTLFSKTGLDPNVQHQVKLSVKGPSPTRNTSFPNSDTAYSFSLISIVYTAVDDGDNSTGANTTTTDSSNSSSNTSGGASPTVQKGSGPSNSESGAPAATTSSAGEMRHVPGIMSAAVAFLAGFVALGF